MSGTSLVQQVASWPTPAARDHKGANGESHLTNGTGRRHMDQLPNAVAHLFSLPDRPTGMLGAMSFTDRRTLHRHLAAAGLFKRPRTISLAWSAPTRPASRNPARTAWRTATSYQRWATKRDRFWTSARLNPIFVEWLMGWPPGHALCLCSATEFHRFKRRMQSALLALPSASGPWIWQPPAAAPKPVQMDLF